MKKIAKKGGAENSHIFMSSGVDIENRVIHLFDDIEAGIISDVIRGIQLMVVKNKEPINIFINTFGGCAYSSFALYDYIRSLVDITIRTYNIGACMSGGTIIFLAGDERYMYPNSTFMFHTISSISEGKLHDLVDESEECKLIFGQMCDIYGNHGKLTSKDWAKKLRYRNIYVRAEEAIKLQIITDVIKY